MRSLQSKEQNVQSVTKMDFLITHIPPEGILDEGRGSLPLLLEVYRSQPRFHVLVMLILVEIKARVVLLRSFTMSHSLMNLETKMEVNREWFPPW